MTDRIFQQYAQGFGSSPCQVICQIDGNTVFDGAVTTTNQPISDLVSNLPNLDYTLNNVAWTWTGNVEFSGTQSLSISVTGSPLLLGPTLANNPYDVANIAVFHNFYVANIAGTGYADPLSNVAIGGVLQTPPNNPSENGQRWWTIPAGSTFTASMNVDTPAPPPPQ